MSQWNDERIAVLKELIEVQHKSRREAWRVMVKSFPDITLASVVQRAWMLGLERQG